MQKPISIKTLLLRAAAASGIALPCLLADRLTKSWAEGALNAAREVVPGVLAWHYTENTGMAFSMLADSPVLLTGVTALLLAAVLTGILLSEKASRIVRAGLSLVLAGGSGNLWDRIVRGYVIDFIELRFVRFAVFNVADICVCVGAGLCILALMLGKESAQ